MSRIDSPLLTAQEACAYLRVGRSWLTTHRAALGAIKVGTALRFRRADLDAYLDRQRIGDAPAPTSLRRPAPRGVGPTNPVTGRPYRYWPRREEATP